MKYRKLGKTDIEVSEVCLGCMGLVGENQAEADSVATIHAALDAGITFFDTARGYQGGRNEELLGRVLRGIRDRVIVATKLNAIEPKDIATQCEESLRRLGTDRIDLYQIHWPRPEVKYDTYMRALERLKADGKVRALGVSNFGTSYMQEVLESEVRIESNQLQYNVVWRPIEHEVLPLCTKNEVSILCYSALNMGLLSGKFRSSVEVPLERARHRLFSSTRQGSRHSGQGCEKELFETLGRIRGVAQRIGKPMSAVTMAWLLSRHGIASIIAGARFPDQVKENVAASGLRLSARTLNELTRVSEPIKRFAGTNCDQWEDVSRMERV